MTFSKTISTIAMAGAVSAFALTAATTADAEMKRISIGTNPAGTMYFVLGGGLAKLFQEKLKIRSSHQPHAGSSVYLPLLNKGEMTMGLNSSLDNAMAYAGQAPFTSPTKKVRSLARIWQLPYAYFVRKSSGMKTVADLRGKRVVVNIKPVVSLKLLNTAILEAHGLKSGDYKAIDVGGIGAGISMVTQGKVDASVTAMGIPILLKAHAGIPGGIQILSMADNVTDAVMARGMAGSRTTMVKPSKRNVGVDKPMKIGAFDTFVNAGANVTNEDAYILVKTMHENWDKFRNTYKATMNVKPNMLAPALNPIPYHPGAIRYYKEAGLWTAANDKIEASLK